MDEQIMIEPVDRSNDEAQGQGGAQTPKKAARWEDIIDIFFTPKSVFERRAEDRVGPALFTVLGLALAVYFILLPVHGMTIRASLADNPEAAAAVESMGSVMQIFGAISIPIVYLISMVIGAALLWLVGKLFDVKAGFSRMFKIAVYSSLVLPLGDLLRGMLIYLHGEAGLDPIRHGSLGLLRFVGEGDVSPMLMAALGQTDLFYIWAAVLWGVGLVAVCRADRGRAAMVAAFAWVLSALPGVIGAFIGTALGGG